VSVTEGCDPGRVVAAGPGLQRALTGKPNNFNIVTRYSRRFLAMKKTRPSRSGAVADSAV